MKLICTVAVALMIAPTAVAQPFFFSEPTPLTTTRYAGDSSNGYGARLVTNGVQPYLLWDQNGKVRITPVTPERRAGRPVLDAYWPDAVWTGSHFLVVGSGAARCVGRRVGADGEAIGEPFTVVEGVGECGRPSLAFDGARVLLLFGQQPLKTVVLSRDGRPLEEPRDAPLEQPLTLDTDATARSGEFLIAAAGRDRVSTASLKTGGPWTRNDRTAIDFPSRQIATAASAAHQLTIWTNGTEPMRATYGPPGALTDYTLAGTNGATRVGVAWDGRDYVYAYRIGTRLHFRYFNATLPFASVDAGPDSPAELLSLNGRTYAAFFTNAPGQPLVVRDVLALSSGDAGAFVAASQSLQSSASSATSALFVWFEGQHELHAGVRTSGGAWYERQLPNQDELAPLAASDGSGFAIVQAHPDEGGNGSWTATLLDAQANLVATAPRMPFYPTGIAWTGDAYAVVGIDRSQRVVGSRLLLSGIVTPPLILALPRAGRQVDAARVAARDGELLVLWMDFDETPCGDAVQPCPLDPIYDVLGARFTPLLQRLDAQSLLFGESSAIDPHVVWDGTRYVIAWHNRQQALQYRTMRTNAAVSGISTVAGARATAPRLTVVPGGVAVSVDEGKVVFLRDGAETVMQLGEPHEQAVARIGSRVAYVQALARDEMPYHGASRLNIRIGDLVPPAPKPSAPQITRADHPTGEIAMIVEWTAPPEPVNGYRVEYRVDDGVWNELDFWFDARTRRLVIRPWRSDPVRYQFRVRAVNDAGFGPYSNAATVRTRKTRAVR